MQWRSKKLKSSVTDVRVGTWNACGMSSKEKDIWGSEIQTHFANTIVCVQEPQNLRSFAIKNKEEEAVPGFSTVFSSDGLSGILVPRGLSTGIKWQSDGDPEFSAREFVSGCVVGNLGTLSAYFVHVNRGLDLFAVAIDNCRSMFKYIVSTFPEVKSLSLGCDLNIQISDNIEGVTGGVVWEQGGGGSACEERERCCLLRSVVSLV